MSDAEEKKPVRVALTKSQAAEGFGLELVHLATRWLEDGRFSEDELVELQGWLNRCPEKSIPAIRFIREEVHRYLQDGEVMPWELDRLFAALMRVIPAEKRKIAKAAREVLAKREYDARAPEREAARRAKAEYWSAKRAELAEIWADEPATEAQLDFISELGENPTSSLSKLDASLLIDRLLSRKRGDSVGIPNTVLVIIVVVVAILVLSIFKK